MPNFTFLQGQGIVDMPSTMGCQTSFIVKGVQEVVGAIPSGNNPAGNMSRLPFVSYQDVFLSGVFGRPRDVTFPFGPY